MKKQADHQLLGLLVASNLIYNREKWLVLLVAKKLHIWAWYLFPNAMALRRFKV